MRKQAGSWLALLAEQEDDAQLKQLLSEHGEFFEKGVETTHMTKSFKGFLYQAFLDLDGVREPAAIAQLAKRSRQLLEHRPDDLRNELPASIQQASAESRAWLTYWRKNPIHYSCQQDKNSNQAWFIDQDGGLHLILMLRLSCKRLLQTTFKS